MATSASQTKQQTTAGGIVRGIVYDAGGIATPNLIVRAFDKDLRSEQLLGEAITDASGNYQIRYERPVYEALEKAGPDLLMRVFDQNGKQQLFQTAVDDILFNAPANATIDIHLRGYHHERLTEFERLTRELEPLLDKVAPADLQENDTNRDITFLARETGWSFSYIEYYAVAHKLQQQFQLLPAFSYGLFRKGTLLKVKLDNPLSIHMAISVNADLQNIWYSIVLADPADVVADIQQAIKERIIPNIERQVNEILARLKPLRDEAVRYVQNDIPKKLIGLVQQYIDSGKHVELMNLSQEQFHGDISALWDRISNLSLFKDAGKAREAATDFNLGSLLGPDEDMISHAKQSLSIKSESDIPRLARLDKESWKKVLNAHPDERTRMRMTDPSRLDQEADKLIAGFAHKYPSAAFLSRFERHEKTPEADKKEIGALLDNHPGINLNKAPVDTLLKDTKASEETKASLRTAQRLFRLSPDFDKVQKMKDENIHSAHHIAELGEKQFVKKFTENGTFDTKQAKQVFKKASDINIASALLAAELKDYFLTSDMELFGGKKLAAKIQAVSSNFPNYKTLFEGTDLCECEHCRSIYSPAAYLADVLQFLKKRLLMNGTHAAKDVLFERRPDLGDIDLNCDNANTPVPYIDLVCEILEEAISPDPGLLLNATFDPVVVDGGIQTTLYNALRAAGYDVTTDAIIYPQYLELGIPTFILRDKIATIKIKREGTGWRVKALRQTHYDAETLAAVPEYVNTAAYTVLQTAQSRFNLPFDYFHEEGRAMINVFDTSRADLMLTLQTGGIPSESAIAAEYLGISDGKRNIIINAAATAGQQAIFWNTGILPLILTVQEVENFLRKSGLEYKELTDMLKLDFINPGDNFFIQHLDSSCSTEQKIIANLDVPALDRMHRFIRLWRIMKEWTQYELNRAITYPALGNNLLNDDTLKVLAQLSRLKTTLGLTNEKALSLYGLMPDDTSKSIYQKTWLNKSITNPLEEAFKIENIIVNEGLPPGTQDLLENHIEALRLCLRRKEDEVNFLIDKLKTLPTDQPPLTRANLAFMYRNHILAQALKIPLADMYVYADVTGLALFASPTVTQEFAEKVRFVQTTGLKLADLLWFLRNEDATGKLGISDADIKTWLEQLQKVYQDAYNTLRSTFDATLSSDENSVSLRNVLASLPQLGADDVNKLMSIVAEQWNDSTTTPDAFIDSKLLPIFDTTDIKNKRALLAAALPANKEAARNDLIQSMMDSTSVYLFHTARVDLLSAQVQQTFNLSDVLTSVLLNDAHLKDPVVADNLFLDLLTTDAFIDKVNPVPVLPAIILPAFDSQYRTVRLMKKMTQYINKLTMTAAELQWWIRRNGTMGWLELDRLRYQDDVAIQTFADWQEFHIALQLMQSYGYVPDPDDITLTLTLSWQSVWEKVATGAPKADVLDILVKFTGWSTTDVNDLDAYFAFAYPADYKLPQTYEKLDKATAILRLLGVPISEAKKFIQPILTAASTAAIKNALRGKYTDEQWLDVMKPVQDELRPQKRDALITWMLADNPSLKDSNDLFDYYLIDVEMCKCQPSSRIVLAHGTVQLFAQRCLLGIEPDAIANRESDSGWDQWKWMANYRVWEANRKIFTYPENWMEPTLRDDKSYFYTELEEELQQDEVTDRAVEDAAIHYLDKLDDVASLDVRACYYDVGSYTEHVFARVPGGSTYYYRTFVKERSWTPWIKVDVDISGDHLLAYFRNKRLYLAWPLLTEEVKRDETQSFSLPFTNQTPPVPKKRYQVQLAVSEYVNKQWQPKRLSQNTLPTEWLDEVTLAQQKDTLRLVNMDMGTMNGYGILCTFQDNPIGIFNLTGCKGYPEAYPSSGSLPFLYFIPQFDQTSFRQMQYRENNPRQNGDTLASQYIMSPFAFQTITNNTPGIFRVTYPHQVSLIDWLFIIFELWLMNHYKTGFRGDRRGLILPLGSFMPFFYADASRRYVIVPGFYDREGNNGRTFSDIHKFISDVIALAIKYIQKLFEVPAPTLAQLQAELNADSEFIRLKAEWEFYKTHQPQLMFKNFYHPLVCFIKATVYDKGLPGIYKYSVQAKTNPFNFGTTYNPTGVVALPYPIEDIDFDADGSYSSYNWELFFHLPFFIATQLSQNQKFEDAHKWFHYIFNPLGAESGSAPQKYWVTKPFHEFFDYIDQRIDTIMTNLASDPTGTVYKDLVHAVDDWRDKPFMPYVVGRARPLAFQKAVVMKYLDNLIGWGDYLFRQDTMESVTQATQFYILAARLLGPKPRIVPPAVPTPYNTYNQLEVKLDAFSNALLDIENLVPDLSVLPHEGEELPPAPITLSALYFCIPANENLLAYWDKIADRLYKLRHCQDIEGVERVLALFAPPIDPAMLVRAAASGLDISTVLGDMNAPLPIYRYAYISQKANELVQEVKYLGATMLSVLEKKDAEALALLRQSHEISLLKAVLEVRKKQIEEAIINIDALTLTKEIAHQREVYYNERDFMNEWEITQAAISAGGIISEIVATVLDATSGGTHMIPIITGGGAGFGGSPVVTVSFGGNNVGSSTGRFATLFRGIAGILHSTAGLIGNIGAYQRRQDEWDFQKDQAIAEQKQLQKQIDAANIRKTIAELEKSNQELEIENSKKVETFLKTKFTNKDLYTWMQGQLATVFFQSYKLAYDMAKKAEQTYRYELAEDSNFIKFGYWDSMKKGLLAGEKLMLDLKKMDSAYISKNKRQKELTKHISLASLSPMALTQLRNTGKCSFDIPELIFDMDYPGQYHRQLKSVAVSIPCVAGPYTTVACRLSMVSNRYRKNTTLKSVGGPMEKYMEEAGNDDRFVYNPSAIQSIATSSAQNDSGLFELNFRDERYLPFEGAGAIGTWSLDMNDPALIAQFDYQSITDVILHFYYTARDGGSKFKQDTVAYLKPYLTQIADAAPAEGLFRAFDLKHELSNEWHKFMTDGSADFSASMSKEVFPWFTHNNLATLSIKRSTLFFVMKEDVGVQITLNGGAAIPMIKNASKFGNNVRYLDFTDFMADLVSMSDSTNFTFHVNNFGTLASKIDNIWLIHNYGYQLP